MLPLLVVTVVNFASVPLFLRSLGPEMYALWFYVITFTGVFGFADLGLGVSVGRYLGVALGKGDHVAVREYWGTGNLIAIPLIGAMAVAFAVLGAVFGPAWFDKVPPESISLLRACFVAGGISLFLSFYAQFWNILSQAQLDFKFSSLLRLAVTLFQVIPSIFIAWMTGNPLWLILWTAISSVLQLALFIGHARRHYQLGLNLRDASRARAREMAAYTAKTFATLVLGAFFANIDRVILGRLALPGVFAHYSVCGNVGLRLQGLGGAVMGPVFHNTSRLVGRDHGSAGRIFDEMFVFMFGWYSLAVAWVLVWHPVFMRWWLGADIGGQAAPLLFPLVAGFCIMALASVSGAQLGALNRLEWTLGIMVLAGLGAILGVYLGWQMGGIVGSAYGFLASRVVFVGQDLLTARWVQARGWLHPAVWRTLLAQALMAGLFGSSYLVFQVASLWLVVLAVLHAGIVTVWLVRVPLRRMFFDSGTVSNLSPDRDGTS